jgi:hypothetical protein
MECIYYKGKTGLNEKGQEHIFPAGLGGIKKLPKGYVSYEANNYFSKLEDHLMHGSLVMFHRSIFGPSKRKDKKEGKRIITVMEISNTDGSKRAEFGFIREGTPYPIAQVYIMKDHMTFTVSPEGGVEELNSFIQQLKTGNGRIIRKTSDLIKGEDVIIGYSQKTIYAGINPDNNTTDDVLKALIKKAVDLYTPDHQMKHAEGQISSGYKLSETMGDYRVFGKIAFNVLAEIKGKDYVLNSDFDKYREWLMGNDDPDYDGFLPSLEKNDIEKNFPENSHWCILLNIQGDLCAVVCLYNTFKRYMVISKGRGCDIDRVDGMICDWKNEKEYRLIEYISHMTGTDELIEERKRTMSKKKE